MESAPRLEALFTAEEFHDRDSGYPVSPEPRRVVLMRTLLLWPVMAATLIFSCMPCSASDPAPPVLEKVRVDLVNLTVVVTDRRGNPVHGLTEDDFTVFEDGKRVEITNFRAASGTDDPGEPPSPAAGRLETSPAPDPMQIVVYVDMLNLHPIHRNRVFQRLDQFLKDRIPPDVPVMLVTGGPRIEIVRPFTVDRERITTDLDRLREVLPVRLPDADGSVNRLEMVYDSLDSLRTCVEQPRCNGEAVLSSAISQIRAYSQASLDQNEHLLRSMRHFLGSLGAIPGRKALVYVTDGFPLSPGQDLHRALREGIEKEWREASFELGMGSSQQGGGSSSAANADLRRRVAHLRRLLDIAERSLSGNLPADLSRPLESVSDVANANGIRLYSIIGEQIASGAAGADTSSQQAETAGLSTAGRARELNRRASLELMADITGGTVMRGSVNTGKILERVLRDADNQYSIGFRSDKAADGEVHRIKIKVRGRGNRPRYARTYIGRTRSTRMSEQLLAAMFLERGDNPYQIFIHVGESMRDELLRTVVPLTVSIPVESMALTPIGEVHATDLTVLIGTRNALGAITSLRQVPVPVRIPSDRVEEVRQQAFPVRLTVPAQPGSNTVVVGVWDGDSTVPSFAGGVYRPEAPAD